jgi:hypothetical protein
MRFMDCSQSLDFGVSAGIGWTEDTVRSNSSQVVDALHPLSAGIIEYEVRVTDQSGAVHAPGQWKVTQDFSLQVHMRKAWRSFSL